VSVTFTWCCIRDKGDSPSGCNPIWWKGSQHFSAPRNLKNIGCVANHVEDFGTKNKKLTVAKNIY